MPAKESVSRFAQRTRRWRWAALWAFLSCSPSNEYDLTVFLRTDYVAGFEAVGVVVELDGAESLDRLLSSDLELFDPGFRVGSLRLAPGAYRLRVTLRGVGEDLGSREVLVRQGESNTAVTIVISSACSDVTCGPGLSCLGGDCLAEECTDGTQQECVEQCSVASDCPEPPSSCVSRECLDGVCIGRVEANACGTDEFCSATGGCSLAEATPDGGLDGGILDSGGRPGLTLDCEDTQAIVRVDTRFELRFAASHDWAPRDWFDLRFADSVDVGGLDSGNRKFDVLQSPLGIRTEEMEWLTIGDLTASELLSCEQPDASSAMLSVEWTWSHPLATFNATITHLVQASGEWTVDVDVRADRDISLDGHEYAYTNVSDLIAWRTTTDATSFSFHGEGSLPQPQITVTRTGVGILGVDNDNNSYFASGATNPIGVNRPLLLNWTNQIWQP